MADDKNEVILISDSESDDERKCFPGEEKEKVEGQGRCCLGRRFEKRRVRQRHAFYPDFSGSSSEDDNATVMKWTELHGEERSASLVMKSRSVKTIHTPHSNHGRRKSVKQREKTKLLSKVETIVISSSNSDNSEGELDAKDDPVKMARNVLSAMPVSFPPSPQSELGEGMEQDISTVLELVRPTEKSYGESHPYTPVSPASITSPPDSSLDLSDEESPERWKDGKSYFHALAEHHHNRIPSFKHEGKIKREREKIDSNGLEEVVGYNRDTSVSSTSLERGNSDMSDFEEVLSKSTAIALSQVVSPSSDESVESEEELPEIDYYHGEMMAVHYALEEEGNNLQEPPVLEKYCQSLPHEEVDSHRNIAADMRNTSPTPGLRLEAEDGCTNLTFYSHTADKSDEISVEKVRQRYSVLKGNETCPQHLWICNREGMHSSHNALVKRKPTHFTSHMVNLIEACHDEHFVDSAVTLIGSFTTHRMKPSIETVGYLFNSVILGQNTSVHEVCQAYQVLQHVNRLHPITTQNFEIKWEVVSNIVCDLLRIAMCTSSSFEETDELNNDLSQEGKADRLMLAMKFVICVMDNSVFQDTCSSRSKRDSVETFVVERHMVKDVLLWLEESITLDLLGSFREQLLVQQLVELLQKIISISCLEGHGDHLDFIAQRLVHKLDELSLPQKQHLLQTTCHRLRCKLVELYLETRYEVPSCPSCRMDCSTVYLPRRLSIAKIFTLHVHQRPLQATQNVNDEKDFAFVEEETGEWVRCDENPGIMSSVEEDNAIRRHCLRCSKRIPLNSEQCEEFLLFVLLLVHSFLACANAGNNLSKNTITLTEEDITILKRLKDRVHILSTDLLLSSTKHSPRTRLYLKQLALFQDTFT